MTSQPGESPATAPPATAPLPELNLVDGEPNGTAEDIERAQQRMIRQVKRAVSDTNHRLRTASGPAARQVRRYRVHITLGASGALTLLGLGRLVVLGRRRHN